jgi:hypothetical protein
MMVDGAKVRWMVRSRYGEVEKYCIPYSLGERGVFGDMRSRPLLRCLMFDVGSRKWLMLPIL